MMRLFWAGFMVGSSSVYLLTGEHHLPWWAHVTAIVLGIIWAIMIIKEVSNEDSV